MAVKVQFQVGHSSKLRSKKTVEGFTHDWELYVRGVQQADISTFVEKIIFNLHESFQKPKRVCNKPPYAIQESGYAGFIVFIDIYFRNRDEPKKVQFNYDLDLQQTGPPQHRHDIKTFIFDNPAEEYRQKLLKGGGVPVSGVVAGPTPALNNLVSVPSTTSLNLSSGEVHKSIISEGKKHKSRPEEVRTNSFANLFGPPITKNPAGSVPALTKHSPDSKSAIVTPSTVHQSSTGGNLTAVKEKPKDKEKTSEKSKERSDKKDKHHKQSLNSPHKEARSEYKKSDGSKHEKRDKTEEKSKKDRNRDKDRERDRDKFSGNAVNNNSTSNNKRPTSPKPSRDSPQKSLLTGSLSSGSTPNLNNTNSISRPSSSNGGKLEDKISSKIKDSTGESKSKDAKQKESSSSSSSKKSKKEKKDKDKDKERDKEKRYEEREKQKLAESQQRAANKEDINKASISSINTNNTSNMEKKSSVNSLNTNSSNTNHANEAAKKAEKSKQDLFKTSDKTTLNTIAVTTNPIAIASSSTNHHNASDKKPSSSSFNSNTHEKDKRSHKHKKKEKSKDKDKERDRDKDRDKEKDKERDRDKDKDKDKDRDRDREGKKEKENKEKHTDDNANTAKILPSSGPAPPVHANKPEELASNSANLCTANANSHLTTAAINSTSSSSLSSTKSSKNKDKKLKEKSREDKLKHKSNELDPSESKAKQPKISSSGSSTNTNSLSTSSSSNNSTTIVNNATINTLHSSASRISTTAVNAKSAVNINLDLSDADSLPAVTLGAGTPQINDSNTTKKPLLPPPSPIITHSDSSNSNFTDLPLPKQPQQTTAKPTKSQERPKAFTTPPIIAPPKLLSPASKEPPKINKSIANANKEKPIDKSPKDEEKEKKRRRNSQAVNTFIEPPLKQLKTKEPTKSAREKSKSPSLRNSTASRTSLSTEASTTFLQPSVSPSSTAAAAPLPPPSLAPTAAHSPSLSATEAVGNAISATANAATCNNNSTTSSTINSTGLPPPNQLPLDYLSELQELHHKIMTLQDNEDLQHVVELIAATGCYEITTKTFDFDLCKLDRSTVQRLQEFFAASVS